MAETIFNQPQVKETCSQAGFVMAWINPGPTFVFLDMGWADLF
jgi:hypothetical protein